MSDALKFFFVLKKDALIYGHQISTYITTRNECNRTAKEFPRIHSQPLYNKIMFYLTSHLKSAYET